MNAQTPTTLPPSTVIARAIAVAVAVIAVAALALGALSSALTTDTATAPSAAAAPAPPAEPAQPAEPAEPAEPAVPAPPVFASTHTVVAGDTLATIAERWAVPAELIAADNGLTDPDRIDIGQVLALSTPPSNVVVIAAGTTLTDHADQHATTVPTLMTLNPQITDPDDVQAGDGLRVA